MNNIKILIVCNIALLALSGYLLVQNQYLQKSQQTSVVAQLEQAQVSGKPVQQKTPEISEVEQPVNTTQTSDEPSNAAQQSAVDSVVQEPAPDPESSETTPEETAALSSYERAYQTSKQTLEELLAKGEYPQN